MSFDVKSAQRISREVTQAENTGAQPVFQQPSTPSLVAGTVRVSNSTGGTIPPYACMEIYGSSDGVLQVRQPTSDDNPNVIFNTQTPFKTGTVRSIKRESIFEASVSSGATSESTLGSSSGSWELASGSTILNQGVASSGVAYCRFFSSSGTQYDLKYNAAYTQTVETTINNTAYSRQFDVSTWGGMVNRKAMILANCGFGVRTPPITKTGIVHATYDFGIIFDTGESILLGAIRVYPNANITGDYTVRTYQGGFDPILAEVYGGVTRRASLISGSGSIFSTEPSYFRFYMFGSTIAFNPTDNFTAIFQNDYDGATANLKIWLL